MLIKTDSQNYTNIADAIREVTGSTKQYKPEEMEPALAEYIPECAISYDTVDSNGYVLTATTYGKVVKGLSHHRKLQSLNISEEATMIGEDAFYYCGLTDITIPSNITVLDNSAFNGSKIVNVVLPEGITTIGSFCFSMSDLASINLPDTITSIGYGAFDYTDLTSITFPKNITEVPGSYVSGCSKLVINSLPSHVTKIGSYSFNNCKAITEFTLHDKITHIDYYAFKDCVNLATFTFEGTPEEIGYFRSYAGDYRGIFEGCTNLTTINVPWSEGEVPNAPWGATNATVNYNYTGE